MVIVLNFSFVATHMGLFTDLFAFITFKSRKTRMAEKNVIFQNF